MTDRDCVLEELREKLKLQSEVIEKLTKEVSELKKENIALKEKLGLTSRNSNIPTSKELYKIQKKSKKKSDRKAGGQPGHEGKTYSRMEATEVVEVALKELDCVCGGHINVAKERYIHQKIDLPKITPTITEYQIAHGKCNKCGKRRSAGLPAGVTRDRFGPRLQAAISSLSGFYKNSKRDIEKIVSDMFGIKMSLGSISNCEKLVSENLKENYHAIEKEVTNSTVVHMDETSHYNKGGKLGWCWLFASSSASLIKLTTTRGKKVLEDSPFGSKDHIVVSDRYAAYNYFDREMRQICWSHLVREFTRLSHSKYEQISRSGRELCDLSAELFAIRNALIDGQITKLIFLRRANKIRKRFWKILKCLEHIQPAGKASSIARNIIKAEDLMWTYLYDPVSIPMTNNFAEQQIRHYVVYRKNSYFTQSDRGNRFLERIISLYLSARQQGNNPFQLLLNLLQPQTLS